MTTTTAPLFGIIVALAVVVAILVLFVSAITALLRKRPSTPNAHQPASAAAALPVAPPPANIFPRVLMILGLVGLMGVALFVVRSSAVHEATIVAENQVNDRKRADTRERIEHQLRELMDRSGATTTLPAGPFESLDDSSLSPPQDKTSSNGTLTADIRIGSQQITVTSDDAQRLVGGLVDRAKQTIEARRAKKQADSAVEQSAETEPADDATETSGTTEQAVGDKIVVFQLSEAAVTRLIGEHGREVLQALSNNLPDNLQQTYALIPLTAPGTSAVAPGTQTVEHLQTIAASIEAILGDLETAQPDAAATSDIAGAAGTDDTVTEAAASQQTDTVTQSAELSIAPLTGPRPAWVDDNPPGTFVVNVSIQPSNKATESFSNDELFTNINAAFQEYLEAQNREYGHHSADWIAVSRQLRLSESAIRQSVVATYDRLAPDVQVGNHDDVFLRHVLVRFPEDSTSAIAPLIQASLQERRVAAVTVVTVLGWLALVSIGMLVRTLRSTTLLRKLVAVPLLVFVTLPLGLATAGTVVRMVDGTTPEFPWPQHQIPAVSSLHVTGAELPLASTEGGAVEYSEPRPIAVPTLNVRQGIQHSRINPAMH